jgi:hypothetical protein
MTARALDTSARRTNGGCDPRRWRRRANDGDVALPLFELRDRRLPTSLVEASRRRRPTFRERGYGAEWDRESLAFRRAFPFCGMRPGGRRPVMSRCFERGLQTPATVTDHVRPHRGDFGFFWDREANWQSLCGRCHAAKTRFGL